MPNGQGFTLIELLVVVLIIGILAAVAAPQYKKSVERARAAEGMTIVSSLAKAGKMYTTATGDTPQFAKWSDLDITYNVPQPDQTGSSNQMIGDWSCRFYDLYVGCDRQGGNVSYSLQYYLSGDLLQCMAGTDDGKAMCRALGCQYIGGLAGTPTYIYYCNRPGSPGAEQPYVPHPPCTPQTVCNCPPPPVCTCPPPLPPCTPETVCPACDTPPCPCYITPCPAQPPCSCPPPQPCLCYVTDCPVY